MIKLSKRLQTIADFVEEKSKIIDVGCDHGLLDIYLTKYKKCKCLATDISTKCLEKAQENIKNFNLEKEIDTKVTNGLNNINYSDFDIIIISGMGFQTINNILKDKEPKKLIIQSNNNIEELRKELTKKYKIINEKIVFENNIYYVILYLQKGKQKYKYADYIIGLSNNLSYIEFLYNKYLMIYNKMPNKHILQKLKIYRKLRIIKKHKKTLVNN